MGINLHTVKLTGPIKALIISALICANLALLLLGAKLSDGYETDEQSYDVAYDPEQLEALEEALAQAEEQPKTVTTHKVYNQTAQELKSLEKKSNEDEQSFQERLAAMDQVLESNKNESKYNDVLDSKEEASEIKKSEVQLAQSDDSNSTNSYRLVGRNAIVFPNPVYTCDTSGKVVVNITVSKRGSVLEATINESSSNTANGCLWDMAIKYAKRSRFSQGQKETQLGSITYTFPGQN